MLVLSLLSVAVVIDEAVVGGSGGGGGGGNACVSYLVYFRSVILSMVNNVWLKMRILFTVQTSQNHMLLNPIYINELQRNMFNE